MGQISVPFRINAAGYVDTIFNPSDRITANVLSALCTRIGERMMKGDYGSTIPDRTFDNIALTYQVDPAVLIEEEASRALAAYFPSVRLSNVTVQPTNDSYGAYQVDIQFTLNTDSVDRTASVTVTRDLLTGS